MRVNCQTRARARPRAMHGENLRKFTETRARAPRALCIDFLSNKNTVCMMQPTKVPVLNFVQQLQIMLQIMLYIYSYY
jgi:hypothetical protein